MSENSRRRNVTIFTDASLCPQTKAAGWGLWIKHNERTIRENGVFKMEMIDSTEAETAAIVNALYVGRVRQMIQDGDFLCIQSDSEQALLYLESLMKNSQVGNLGKRWNNTQELNVKFQELLPYPRIHRFKHVPGHQGNGNRRTAVNEITHRLARSAMIRERLRRTKK